MNGADASYRSRPALLSMAEDDFGPAPLMTLPDTQAAPRPRRIEAIDAARGGALIAMAIYHFAWDLEFFHYVPPGMTAVGGWKLFARCIASSFLFLAGVSLFLAHGDGIRWQGFWSRFAMVAGAALAISVVTWLALPGGFIFFGILHQIALASLLGLAFLRMPAWSVLLAAAAVIAAPHYLRSDAFNNPAFLWLGLSSTIPRSNDYVPVFPWFGAVLIGIGAAKLAKASGLFARLAQISFGRRSKPLLFAGRHSLAFYLIHQPVLIVGVWAYAQMFPAAPDIAALEAGFARACETSCRQSRDAEFCTRYCLCMLDTLKSEKAIDGVYANDPSPELRARVEEIAGLCTAQTDGFIPEGGTQ